MQYFVGIALAMRYSGAEKLPRVVASLASVRSQLLTGYHEKWE